MPLSDDDVNAVLLRADQIQRAAVRGANEAEVRRFVEKAEASGYSREAVLQALRERFGVTSLPVAAGDRVFARTSDGKFRAATVVSPDTGHGELRIRHFLGTEQTLGPDDVRPFSLAPGERVGVQWPHWGAWSCELVSYDAATDTVRLSDRWGSEKEFRLSDIWLEPPSRGGVGPALTWVALMGAGGVIAAILGTLVVRMLP